MREVSLAWRRCRWSSHLPSSNDYTERFRLHILRASGPCSVCGDSITAAKVHKKAVIRVPGAESMAGLRAKVGD